MPLIQASEELSKLFSKRSIFPAFRRPKNLKVMVNSKSKDHSDVNNNKNGCFKCNGRCDFCSIFMQQTDSFCSVKTGRKCYLSNLKVSKNFLEIKLNPNFILFPQKCIRLIGSRLLEGSSIFYFSYVLRFIAIALIYTLWNSNLGINKHFFL